MKSLMWSEKRIGQAISSVLFKHSCICIVPNCSWPGAECDLLCVRKDLRLVDIEIKISRADLKADKDKSKWVHPWDWRTHGWDIPREERIRKPRTHPPKIWKHYYAFPQTLWTPDLMEIINPYSGIVFMREG
jgi:hypothetical protein